jgi:hypothetical protein
VTTMTMPHWTDAVQPIVIGEREGLEYVHRLGTVEQLGQAIGVELSHMGGEDGDGLTLGRLALPDGTLITLGTVGDGRAGRPAAGRSPADRDRLARLGLAGGPPLGSSRRPPLPVSPPSRCGGSSCVQEQIVWLVRASTEPLPDRYATST